jgi:hypothetical protein
VADITDILNEHEDFVVYALLITAIFLCGWVIYHFAVLYPCQSYHIAHRIFGGTANVSYCGV